jgi:hypothetical protein
VRVFNAIRATNGLSSEKAAVVFHNRPAGLETFVQTVAIRLKLIDRFL